MRYLIATPLLFTVFLIVLMTGGVGLYEESQAEVIHACVNKSGDVKDCASRTALSSTLEPIGLGVGIPPIEPSPCTLQSLSGTYKFTSMFVNYQNSGAGQSVHSSVVTITFDGSGNLTFAGKERKVDQNGVLTTDTPTGIGTYTMNSDCSFVITTPGGGFSSVVVLGGKGFIQTEPGGGFKPNENGIGIGIFQQ